MNAHTMRARARRSVAPIAAAGALALLAAPAAEAHRVAWFWGEGRAELKYQTRYDVEEVVCSGYGRRIRGDLGGWLYRHFSCFVVNWDGSQEEDELHVLGRRRFVVYD